MQEVSALPVKAEFGGTMKSRTTRQKHRIQLTAIQRNKCCYCEVTLLPAAAVLETGRPHPRAATLEHVHRLCEGGSNSIRNKAVACFECNTGRKDTDWLTYKSLKMGEELIS